MSTAPTVLAVCVNWNGKRVLGEMLSSLRATNYPRLDVLVVDNASQDGSPGLVRPPTRLLQLQSNQGYAAALNRALESFWKEEEWPEYVLVLNNDLVVQPDTIARLVSFAEQHPPGIVGPQVRLYNQPSKLEAAWGEVVFDHVLARFHGAGQPAEKSPWNRSRQVQLLLGSALLIHREAVRQIGLWDERFFLYHEEVDYLYRARAIGVPVYYCADTWVRHRGGHGTSGQPLRKTYWLRRNTVYFLRKHRAGLGQWSKWLATASASLAFNLVGLRWGRAKAIWQGVKEGWGVEVSGP